MKLTVKEAKRICKEYGMDRKNIGRLHLRDGITFDGLIVLINGVLRHKAKWAV